MPRERSCKCSLLLVTLAPNQKINSDSYCAPPKLRGCGPSTFSPQQHVEHSFPVLRHYGNNYSASRTSSEPTGSSHRHHMTSLNPLYQQHIHVSPQYYYSLSIIRFMLHVVVIINQTCDCITHGWRQWNMLRMFLYTCYVMWGFILLLVLCLSR